MTGLFKRALTLVAFGCAAFQVSNAMAHPHVFVEANLEVVRNAAGEAVSLRHVWRFDELFSSSVQLDFDDNGNGKLDEDELKEIGNVTSKSIAEYNFYTEIRNGENVVNFYEPSPYIVDIQNGQLLIIMALELEKPARMGPEGFKIAVSDPTYYVAIDFLALDAVQVSGNGSNCSSKVVPPDFDALYAQDAERLAKLFAAAPDEEVEASDDYLTWVHFACS